MSSSYLNLLSTRTTNVNHHPWLQMLDSMGHLARRRQHHLPSPWFCKKHEVGYNKGGLLLVQKACLLAGEETERLKVGRRCTVGWSWAMVMRREAVWTVLGPQWGGGPRPSLASWLPEWFAGTEGRRKTLHTGCVPKMKNSIVRVKIYTLSVPHGFICNRSPLEITQVSTSR